MPTSIDARVLFEAFEKGETTPADALAVAQTRQRRPEGIALNDATRGRVLRDAWWNAQDLNLVFDDTEVTFSPTPKGMRWNVQMLHAKDTCRLGTMPTDAPILTVEGFPGKPWHRFDLLHARIGQTILGMFVGDYYVSIMMKGHRHLVVQPLDDVRSGQPFSYWEEDD